MTPAHIAALVAAAVLVFWAIGAYNRLVEMRTAIGTAWKAVDEVLKKRGEAIAALADALRQPLAGEQGSIDALLAAERQVRAAADALGARPVMAPLAAAVAAAEAAMGSASARVLALVAQAPELGASEAVAPHRKLLEETPAQLTFARGRFNEAAQAYNEAARQFPTRLLARLYGFGTAGRV